MAFSLKLDTFNHDIHIKDGYFVRIQGADEVRQRIKVALWHQFGEYFLNRPNGLPWYNGILGSKPDEVSLQNIIRKKVQSVPGVIQVLTVELTRIMRDYTVSISCLVKQGPGDNESTITTLTGIRIGE